MSDRVIIEQLHLEHRTVEVTAEAEDSCSAAGMAAIQDGRPYATTAGTSC